MGEFDVDISHAFNFSDFQDTALPSSLPSAPTYLYLAAFELILAPVLRQLTDDQHSVLTSILLIFYFSISSNPALRKVREKPSKYQCCWRKLRPVHESR